MCVVFLTITSRFWIPINAHVPFKDDTVFSYHCAFVRTGKNDFKKQRLDAGFLEHGERKPQLSKQKRLHVKGALEVNNTRKGSYYFVILIFFYHLLFWNLECLWRAASEWFHCNVLNILTSFLWSIGVQTMENCCRFFFTIIVTVLASTSVEIPRKMVRGRKRTTNWATITSFPWSVIFIEPSSWPVSARESARVSAREITQLL